MLPTGADAIGIFLIGFFGGAHCIGMCGGFAILAGSRGGMSGYALGKTASYGLLGLAAGVMGTAVMRLTAGMSVLSFVVGAGLILVGLGAAGVIPDRFVSFPGLLGRMAPIVASAARSGRRFGTLAIGFVNGFLPCGLVLAALMKAAETGSPSQGGLLMVIFGLATLPALIALGLLGPRLPAVWRKRLASIGGWMVVALGAYTIWRAMMPMGGHAM